jgi:hypothetical protein
LILSRAAFVLFLRFVSFFFIFTYLMRYCFIVILLLRFRSGRVIALFMLIAMLTMILICIRIFLIIMTN